jgi:hypothetical protein
VCNGKMISIVESENVIKNRAEISQVLIDENVEQPVIYLNGTIEGIDHYVTLLGETHIASKNEERAAGRILPYFKYFGCEGICVEGFVEGRLFFWFVDHILSHILFLGQGRSNKNKSFIEEAYEYRDSETKKLFMLENGWKPNTRMRIFFVVFPVLAIMDIYNIATSTIDITGKYDFPALVYIACIIFIVAKYDKIPILKEIGGFISRIVLNYVFDLGPSRNRNMTKNLIGILSEHKMINEIIVLTGSSHTRPIAKILISKYGFVEKSF